MTLALANRKDAIQDRLAPAFPAEVGYGHFDVRLSRRAKHQPRGIKVSWVVYPFEPEVQNALGDLHAEDVEYERKQMWSCGIFHPDAMDAWKAHEGDRHLVYEDEDSCCLSDLSERVLPDHVEEELRATGETFESACKPGNYMRCPTCGGGARYVPDRKTLRFEPCPDCAHLGTDRQTFPGILDLDLPGHRGFYESRLDQARAKVAAAAQREQAKRDRAMTEPTTFAAPRWRPLPTRDAGVLNGIPVAPVTDCDYLTHATDPDRRLRCGSDARWFDPTTGLRVCTRHKRTTDI